MNIWIRKFRNLFLLGTLIVLALICLVVVWQYVTISNLGKGDFIGYWSAAYLLREGKNSYDPAAMLEIQQSLVHSGMDITVMAWNPPPLLVFLLPLAWLPFDVARPTWFIVNLIIIFTAILFLTWLYLPKGVRFLLLFSLFSVLLPQVLSAIAMGQVTLLILFGLTASLTLIRREKWFWAGACLIFTTVKPHIALLATAYLLIYMAYRRKWQGWLGIISAAGLCAVVLTAFRPLWVVDFLHLSQIAPVRWATPTLGGLFSFLGITEWARYLVMLFLPLAWFLARKESGVSVESSVALLTVITVPTTFYGWSYDQSVLLIPIALIFRRMIQAQRLILRNGLIAAFLVFFLAIWLHRIKGSEELFFLWVPLFWVVVYFVSAVLGNSSQTIAPAAGYNSAADA
jgi:hypothetical protein